MREVAIGAVVEAVRTWNPRKAGDSPFRYLDLSSVDQRLKRIAQSLTTLGADAPSRARQLVQTGDVLVSTVRPNLNAVAAVPPDLDGATASTGFCVLRAKPRELDSRYLFHWVRSTSFIRSMTQRATGASYPAVSDKIIKSSPIPLPPIKEQRRLADVLDGVDALRTNRRHALAKLDTLTQAVFIAMVGDPPTLRFPLVALGQLVRNGITRGIDQPGPDYKGGIPYIRTTDLRDGPPKRSDLKRAAPEIAARFPRSVVEQGDIVICIRATVGPSLLVTEALAGANLSRGTARVSPADDVVPEYLFAAMRSRHFQHQIEGRLRGATFLQIPLGELKELVVPLPPVEAQRELVRHLLQVADQVAACSTQAERLDDLSSSLRWRAFRGEL